MKFIVDSSKLLKQLQVLSGVLNTNNTLPILDNILFALDNSKLSLTASDLESTITSGMEVESKDSGKVAIPARILIDTLKTIPNQPLTFNIHEENYAVEIASDYGKYQLSGQNSEEYPKSPDLESPAHIEINSLSLANAIDKSIFAAGNDELRPVMTGVYFELNEDNTVFVATDAHKLVKYTRTDTKSDKAVSFIMPKKPLNILKNILALVDAPVKIEFNETNARFSFNNTTIISRLVEGKYPNYEAVIPKENPNRLTIERNLLLNSVKRVSIFSNKTTHQVKFKISGSALQISAEDLDYSNKANERLKCEYDGEDIEIGFNAKFLIEMLSNLDSEVVHLSMSAPNRAGILTPAEKADENEDLMMLIMPVMIN